jgi:uncharacterized protein YjbJ (UPF0337 family)
MNQEQFGQFWAQLKTPLKAKWEKITAEDLLHIQGDLGKFTSTIQQRYGDAQQEAVSTWAHRRYCTWTGNYVIGYKDPELPPIVT